jgi:tRNA U34 2-thiouridine synthase MnmA/TrmU
LFVLGTDSSTNVVVIGPREALAVRRVEARGRLYLPMERVAAKLRYRSVPVPARVLASNGGFELELEEPAHAVATGQVAALYDGDAVVGAGVITRVS